MESNNIQDLSKYRISSADCFFLDNNVWMFLFCPIGNYKVHKQKAYSRFVADIIAHRATIYINSMVLSEFANTYLRLDFQLWKKQSVNIRADYKKDYLKSNQFLYTVQSVQSSMRNILKLAVRMPDNFNAVNLDNIFNYFLKIDFNDSYFIEYCRSCGKSMVFVSDDKDFSKIDCGSVKILTI